MPHSESSPFKRLLIRIVALAAIIAICNVGVWIYHASAPDMHNSFRAIHRKARMLDTIRAPRIIVVGGSSVVFGQNSLTMEDRIGRPVINMGSHAGIGLRYMMNNLVNKVERGDVVILAPEYAQYNGTFDGWHPLLDLVMQNPEAVWSITSLGQVRTLISAAPVKFKDLLDKRFQAAFQSIFGSASRPKSQELRRDTISDAPGYHGDTWNRERVRRDHPLKDWYPITGSYVDDAALDGIDFFTKECSRRGAIVFLDYPPIPLQFYIESATWIEMLHKTLVDRFDDAVIRPPSASTYPEDFFLDTIYHLNARGREVRSVAMADAINARLVRSRSVHKK